MIGYVTLGTRDLPRAVKFYDTIAKEMGVNIIEVDAKNDTNTALTQYNDTNF